MPVCNAFTVDVEDYYHVTAFENIVSRSRWSEYESRIVANTHRLLDLLDRHDTKATFFVLGWVAEHHRDLVREIDARGHEVGSHSYWHRLVYQQTPDEFRADLVDSKNILEDIIAKPVMAYARCFSIVKNSLWALDILVEEGFRIDASIVPARHDRYGIPDAPQQPYEIETSAGAIWEFPGTVKRFAGMNLPVAGGGYFRLYPLNLTLKCLRSINRSRRPFVFYIHPWEIDPDQPRFSNASASTRMRHYVNLASTERKLQTVLDFFHFDTISTAAAEVLNVSGTVGAGSIA